jgi:hypothetical protein
VLKANGVAFSGLQVQLAEGELTAAKSSYNFNMDAEGFTLDSGVTNMSWDHVRIAAGHATDFQAIIPAVAGNPQATTLQINDKIAFNMSGSYAYMNKDEVHIFDNNASHTATYGTSLVLENVSDNLVLDIGTDGISFTPGYTKISWPDILSAGLPFADSWLFAVNDNASYNTSTLVLNNTLNINDGTADNTINITALSQPSINLANVGTTTSALSSVLNNTNLTITDVNADGAYNNGESILDSVSLSLNHAPSFTDSNSAALSASNANLEIITTAEEGVNSIVLYASDGLDGSFTSTDTFTQKNILFSKSTLSSNSTYNDGTDPLTALTDSFEITSVNSNMAFNLMEMNPISNDSSALHSYQQVSKNNDGVYMSTLDLTSFNSSTNVTNAITVTAVDTANSIANPTINLKVTDSTTTVLESTLANNLLTLTNKDTSLAYVAESLVINSSTYKSEYKPSETETNSVEISSVTTSIHLTETGTETNKATSELSRTILEIKDYNTTTTLNNSKSAITSSAISTEESADGVNTYSVTISSTDASVICSTPLDGTTDTVTISPSQGFVKSFISADTFSESGAILSSTEVRSYNIFNDGNASTAFDRSFEVVTLGQDDANFLMIMINPVNGDSSKFLSGQQTSLNGDGVYKSVAALETFNSATNVSNSITFTAIDTANSISAPVINLNVTGTSTSKPTGSFSNTEMSITDTNTSSAYNNSKTTVLSNNLSIARSTDGVNSKTISMNNISGTTTQFTIDEVETNADSKTLTVDTLGFNVSQVLTSLHRANSAIVSPFDINSTSNFNDSTNNSVVKTLSYSNNTSTNDLTLSHSNPFTSDDSSFTANQRVSVSGDGVYKSNIVVESYNGTTEDTNSITLTAVDTANSISTPVIKLDVTGTSTSKPSGYFSTDELNITDSNTTGAYNNSKVTVLSNNLSISRSTDGVNSKTIAMNNTSGYTTSFSINEFDTNSDYKIVTIDTGVINFAQNLSSLHQTNYANISPSVINSTSNFNDATNHSVVKTLSYANNTSTNSLVLNHSNPVTNDDASFTASQRVSVGGDGVYKSGLDITSFNSSTNKTNSIIFTAIDTANSIANPLLKLDVTGTSTSKPTGTFSNTEMSFTDLNADGEYNNSKVTVLSKNISIVSSTDGVNAKSITLNASGTAEFGISEVETNADYKILTVNTLGFNVNQNLPSLNTTKYVAVSPSAISSTTTFDDATINSVVKYLAYGNNTSTNFFSLVESNPFTEDQSIFSASQRVSVGGDGGYKSNLLVSNYNASTNTTKSIGLTAIDTDGSITDPVIKVNDGTIVSSLKSQSLSSTGHLSLSVPTGKELTLAVPSGADLVIGDGAVSSVADGGLTNLWMRIKIGSSYYKIPLMADMAILDNLSIINADILDRLSQNVNSLSVTDTYTLLLGKSVISYTGDREYWGPPQDTVSTYVSMNNTSYLKLTSFDYVGWDFNSINFTNAGTLNGKIFISLWTDISMTIRFSVVNTTIQSGGVSTEYKTTINTNNGSWTYVQVNLADFVFDKGDGSAVKATVFSNITQFLFATDLNISNPVYIQYVALKRTP